MSCEPVTIELAEPVPAHGEMVASLSLRWPTGKDIREIGYPARMSDEISFDAPVMSRMISRLAAVPTSTVDLLHPGDWTSAATAILGFLQPAKPSSTATTSKPVSGATSAT